MTADEDGSAHFDAFQVSKQCMEMVAEGALEVGETVLVSFLLLRIYWGTWYLVFSLSFIYFTLFFLFSFLFCFVLFCFASVLGLIFGFRFLNIFFVCTSRVSFGFD